MERLCRLCHQPITKTDIAVINIEGLAHLACADAAYDEREHHDEGGEA